MVGAIGVALGDGRPAGRRWSRVALATGALGVILSGAMTAVFGSGLRSQCCSWPRGVGSAAGAAGGRPRRDHAAGHGRYRGDAADTIERFAEFWASAIAWRRPVSRATHRTLLAYIGGRIWLDRPITGGMAGLQRGMGLRGGSGGRVGALLTSPTRRSPPAHPWGIQLLYLQVAADLGIAGIALLLGLAAAAVTAGVRLAPLPPRWSASGGSASGGVWPVSARCRAPARGADVDRDRAGDRPRPGGRGAVTRAPESRLDPPLSMPTYAARAPRALARRRSRPGRRRPRPLPAARRWLRRDALSPAPRVAREEIVGLDSVPNPRASLLGPIEAIPAPGRVVRRRPLRPGAGAVDDPARGSASSIA